MRKLFLTPFLFLALGHSVVAFDLFRPDLWFAPASCPMAAPDISIQIGRSEVLIDHTLDYRSIDVIARDLKGAVMAGWRTNGLAAAQLKSDGETMVRILQRSDGKWCGYVAEGVFRIGYEDPMRIYISSDYPVGGCAYNAILGHELQHVDIYRSVLSAHLDDAAEHLVERFLNHGAVIANTWEDVSMALEEVVDNMVNEIVDGIVNESKIRNAALDTPANYVQVQSTCQDW